MSDIELHLVKIVAGVIATGGTAIAAIWFRFNAEIKALRDAAVDCFEDREKLWKTIASLSGDSKVLANCPLKRCPYLRSGQTHQHNTNENSTAIPPSGP